MESHWGYKPLLRLGPGLEVDVSLEELCLVRLWQRFAVCICFMTSSFVVLRGFMFAWICVSVSTCVSRLFSASFSSVFVCLFVYPILLCLVLFYLILLIFFRCLFVSWQETERVYIPVGGRVGENLGQVSGKKTIIGTYYIKNIFNKRKKEKRKKKKPQPKVC